MRSCSRSLAGVCATARLGFGVGTTGAAVSSFPRFPQADTISAAHSSAGAARRRRPVFISRRSARCVKSATETRDPIGLVDLIPILRPIQTKTGAQSSNHALCPTQHLNLPHPKQFDPWSSPRRNDAADTNPSIFERLRPEISTLERRYDAP